MLKEKFTIRDIDLDAISDLCFEYLKRPKIDFTWDWRDNQHGYADYSQKRIVMPKFAKAHGDTFVIQYFIHELCHLIVPRDGRGGHGFKFKQMEIKLCALFGITFERARVYPTKIYLEDKLVWQHKKISYFDLLKDVLHGQSDSDK